MSDFLGLMKWFLVGGVVLTLALMVLVSLPKSKLRDALLPFAYGAFALLCGAYVVSPVDVMPEIVLGPLGLVDDLGAAVAGIVAIKAALTKPRD